MPLRSRCSLNFLVLGNFFCFHQRSIFMAEMRSVSLRSKKKYSNFICSGWNLAISIHRNVTIILRQRLESTISLIKLLIATLQQRYHKARYSLTKIQRTCNVARRRVSQDYQRRRHATCIFRFLLTEGTGSTKSLANENYSMAACFLHLNANRLALQ